jgi:hypothetical protein
MCTIHSQARAMRYAASTPPPQVTTPPPSASGRTASTLEAADSAAEANTAETVATSGDAASQTVSPQASDAFEETEAAGGRRASTIPLVVALLRGPLQVHGIPSATDIAAATAAATAAAAAVAADSHVVAAQALVTKTATLVADAARVAQDAQSVSSGTTASGNDPSPVMRAAREAADEAAAELKSATALANETHRAHELAAHADALRRLRQQRLGFQMAASSTWWLFIGFTTAMVRGVLLGGEGTALNDTHHRRIAATRPAAQVVAATVDVDASVQRLARHAMRATRAVSPPESRRAAERPPHGRQAGLSAARKASPATQTQAPSVPSWRSALESSREAVPLGAGVSWSR